MKYVVLEGIERGNKFITSYREGDTPESIVKTADGEVSYKLLKFVDTIAEGQIFLFGYATSDM